MSSMLEDVIIPDAQFSTVFQIMDIIRKLLDNLTGPGRTLQIHMFRNFYLQLKNSVSHVLFLHLYFLEGLHEHIIIMSIIK